MIELSAVDVLIRIVIAAVLAGAIGYEREYHRKPAGMRTNMLVAIGTAVMTIASIEIARVSPESAATSLDRIASQILPGIGFIGAGTIIHAKGSVQGLTTAASIWVVASIGMVSGMGLFHIAVITAVLTLVTLVILRGLRVGEDENL